MSRIFYLIAAHPLWAVLVVTAITALAAAGVYDFRRGEFNITYDPSTNRLIPEDDEEKRYYDFVRKVFGSDETMLVAVHADDIFTAEQLRTIQTLTEEIALVDGVHHVVSISNASNVVGDEYGLDVSPLFDEVPTEPEAIDQIRERALGNPLFAGNLISEDARTASILVYFLDFSDREFFDRGIADKVAAIVEKHRGTSEAWLTGQPYIKVEQTRTQTDELRRSFPLVLAALGLVLAFSFRTLRGVILPLVTIVIALIWSMGIAAWIGEPLNPVTMMAPPLLLILGLSYAVHVVSEFYETARIDPDKEIAEIVAESMNEVWLPVALTGLTTAAGFVALCINPMRAIREFGVLALVGVLAAVAASLVATPALLALMGKPRKLSIPAGVGNDAFTRFARLCADLVFKYRTAVLVTFAALTLLAALSASTVRIDSDTVRTFKETAPVRISFEAVNKHLDGANSFSLVLQTNYADAFKEPENLLEVEALQAWLESQPDIGGVTSLVDYVKIMNRGFHENDASQLRIPDSKRFLGQLLFFGAGDDIEGFVDSRYQMVNLTIRTPKIDSADIAELTDRIRTRLAELPGHFEAHITGNPIIVQRLTDTLVSGQVYSIGLAMVLIYLILSALFLSARTGFIALIPNVVPIALFFGALGLTGVTLNTGTSLIAPMALGIAIDDTIHYFARFTREAKKLANERAATIRALVSVGRPMTYTTVALCAGFLVFTTSDLQNQVQVGAMGAFALGFAWLVDFTLTPALCSGLRVVTLWDTLTLDLGERPQDSIPLFSGLTATQCRMVSQMASIRTVPAGQPLMRSGDLGREMYIVIDGAAEISVDRPAGRELLVTSRRGDVIGEVGYFFKRRSADVDVIENARLLRLTQNNVDRLTSRYPRLAAKILRNLNEILAERVTRTTDRLRA